MISLLLVLLIVCPSGTTLTPFGAADATGVHLTQPNIPAYYLELHAPDGQSWVNPFGQYTNTIAGQWYVCYTEDIYLWRETHEAPPITTTTTTVTATTPDTPTTTTTLGGKSNGSEAQTEPSTTETPLSTTVTDSPYSITRYPALYGPTPI